MDDSAQDRASIEELVKIQDAKLREKINKSNY
jgi:hypothetical protein